MILYAGSEGRTATGTELTFWALVLNDHLDQPEPKGSRLSDEEVLVADIIRISRFNWSHDRAALFARMQQIFKLQPHRGPWKAPEQWDEYKRSAFDMSADEFLETCLGPLAFLSVIWGGKGKDGTIPGPIVGPSKWLEGTGQHDNALAKSFLQSLTTDREQLQGLLKKMPSGLPQLPSAFYLKPLVRLDEDRLVALSPLLLLEQLRVGLWGPSGLPQGRRERAYRHKTGPRPSETCSKCGVDRSQRSRPAHPSSRASWFHSSCPATPADRGRGRRG